MNASVLIWGRARARLAELERSFAKTQRTLQALTPQQIKNAPDMLCPPKSIREIQCLRSQHLSLVESCFSASYGDLPGIILASFHARYRSCRRFIDLALRWTATRSARFGYHPERHRERSLWHYKDGATSPEDKMIGEAALDVARHAARTLQLPPTDETASCIVQHCANAGRTDDALSLCEKARADGVRLRGHVYGTLIGAFGRKRDLNTALHIHSTMAPASRHAYEAAVAACAGCRNFDAALRMHERSPFPLGKILRNTLMYYASRYGRIDVLKKLLGNEISPVRKVSLLHVVARRLSFDNCESTLKDFVSSCTSPQQSIALVGGAVGALRRGDSKTACTMLLRARQQGLLDGINQLLIVRALLMGKRREFALQSFLQHIVPLKVSTRREGVYRGHVTRLLCKNICYEGKLAEIERLFQAMIEQGFVFTPASMKAVVVCFSRLSSSARVSQVLSRLEKKALISPYNRLRGLLLAATKTDDARHVVPILSSLATGAIIHPRSLNLLRRFALQSRLDERTEVLPLLCELARIAPYNSLLWTSHLVARHVHVAARAYSFGTDSAYDAAFAVLVARAVTLYGRYLEESVLAAAECGRLHEALALFLQARHCSRDLACPSAVTYAALIRLCAHHGVIRDALLIYSDLGRAGRPLTPVLVAEMMLVLDYIDDVSIVKHLRNELMQALFRMDISTGKILLRAADCGAEKCIETLRILCSNSHHHHHHHHHQAHLSVYEVVGRVMIREDRIDEYVMMLYRLLSSKKRVSLLRALLNYARNSRHKSSVDLLLEYHRRDDRISNENILLLPPSF